MLANFASLEEVEQAMVPGKLQIVDDQGEGRQLRLLASVPPAKVHATYTMRTAGWTHGVLSAFNSMPCVEPRLWCRHRLEHPSALGCGGCNRGLWSAGACRARGLEGRLSDNRSLPLCQQGQQAK